MGLTKVTYAMIEGAPVNVLDYGAIGDGSTDDTAAIQSALDTGLNVYFPQGNYKVSDTLLVTTFGQLIFGENDNSETSSGSKISFSNDSDGFLVQEAQVSFKNLALYGPNTSLSIGINAEKLTNTDDIDLSVVGCLIHDFQIGIKIVGRALYATSNIFVSCPTCISSSWPTSGTSGTGDQALPYGYRSYRIINNRAHSTSLFLETTGANTEYFRGVELCNNTIDIGGALFVGGIINSTISNNIVEFSGTTIVDITAGGTGLTISGNVLRGKTGVIANSPATIIYFGASASTVGTVITGNVLDAADVNGMRFDCAVQDLTISSNTIGNVSQDSVAGACIMFEANVTSTSVIGNSFDPVNSVYCVRFSNTPTVEKVSIIANNVISGDLITGAITDNGSNVVVYDDKICLGPLADTQTRALHIENADVVKATFSRPASVGGCSTEYLNSAGSFTIGGLPTGANAGSYGPGTDNSISSASSTNRWSVVYAATGTINTSDGNQKQDIEELNAAEKRVATKIKGLIKKFRFKDAVVKKGNDARIHVGVIAQDVKAVFESEKLDANQYGLFCSDKLEDGSTRLGVRYEELLAFVISAL